MRTAVCTSAVMQGSQTVTLTEVGHNGRRFIVLKDAEGNDGKYFADAETGHL